MIALLQRVTQAGVDVDGESIAGIGTGLLVLVCAQAGDMTDQAHALADRLIRYRVFADAQGRMNRSLLDRQANGEAAGLLLVPQFTLAADTRSGLRPGFTPSASPLDAQALFDAFCRRAGEQIENVQQGRFGADMQVRLTNDDRQRSGCRFHRRPGHPPARATMLTELTLTATARPTGMPPVASRGTPTLR